MKESDFNLLNLSVNGKKVDFEPIESVFDIAPHYDALLQRIADSVAIPSILLEGGELSSAAGYLEVNTNILTIKQIENIRNRWSSVYRGGGGFKTPMFLRPRKSMNLKAFIRRYIK